MTDRDGAGKIFAAEPARNAKPVSLGEDARLYGQSLIFRQGRYLVRIVAYDGSPEAQPGNSRTWARGGEASRKVSRAEFLTGC